MTIDEKLSHFYDITVEEAHEKAAAILDEHKAALEKMAEEHKTLSEENAQTQIKAETASARREINKALSAEQLTIKRDWTRKQNELKEKIFSEVKGLLESFTKTPEYENYLTAKIKEALDFAGNDEITISLSGGQISCRETSAYNRYCYPACKGLFSWRYPRYDSSEKHPDRSLFCRKF